MPSRRAGLGASPLGRRGCHINAAKRRVRAVAQRRPFRPLTSQFKFFFSYLLLRYLWYRILSSPRIRPFFFTWHWRLCGNQILRRSTPSTRRLLDGVMVTHRLTSTQTGACTSPGPRGSNRPPRGRGRASCRRFSGREPPDTTSRPFRGGATSHGRWREERARRASQIADAPVASRTSRTRTSRTGAGSSSSDCICATRAS